MKQIRVRGERDYSVSVGSGTLSCVSDYARGGRALVMHTKSTRAYAQRVGEHLEPSMRVHYLEVPDGEAAKTTAVLAQAWDRAADVQLGWEDLIVSVGGGAVTDLAGFVAATWLRGIDVLHVPTSLLAMVDAAVGGKTGVNTSRGKNLAGAFHSPIGVVADTDLLTTLPRRYWVEGMGEVLKCGFISDPSILDDAAEIISPKHSHLESLIAKSVSVKARVVGADPKEAGEREILNYGHTLAHAIEVLEHFTIAHGEAVSIGCVYAAHVAQEMGLGSAQWLEVQRESLRNQGLPTGWKTTNFDAVLELMQRDKKVRSEHIRMVLLAGPAQPTVVPVEKAVLVRAAKNMEVIDE